MLAAKVLLGELAVSNEIPNVVVRVVSARAMMAMQKLLSETSEPERVIAIQFSTFVFNDQGERLWPTVDAALEGMDKMAPKDVKAIIDMATQLNGLGDEAMEKTEKN